MKHLNEQYQCRHAISNQGEERWRWWTQSDHYKSKLYNTHIHKVSIIHRLCLTMEESFDFCQYSQNHLKN